MVQLWSREGRPLLWFLWGIGTGALWMQSGVRERGGESGQFQGPSSDRGPKNMERNWICLVWGPHMIGFHGVWG